MHICVLGGGGGGVVCKLRFCTGKQTLNIYDSIVAGGCFYRRLSGTLSSTLK